MTAPTTRATPKIALDQRAASRHDTAVRTDHVPRIAVLDAWKTGYRQAGLIMAPSITTPALTYFQSATSSFRASATIVVLRRRPPLRLIRSAGANRNTHGAD